jgi:hypothetical protein
VTHCLQTMALRFAFGWRAISAGKTLNIFPKSSSRIKRTFTERASAPGMAAFEETIARQEPETEKWGEVIRAANIKAGQMI